MPLRAAFALGVGEALPRAGSAAAFVNACYPDAEAVGAAQVFAQLRERLRRA